METLFARHKPRKGMVGLMLAGSLVLHSSLVGIASLWTPPQPEDHSVVIDITEGPTETPGPGWKIDPPPQGPTETPEATATPDVLDPVAPTPPVSLETEFALPPELTPPPRRTTVARTTTTSNRPANPQTTVRSSAEPAGNGVPGGGSTTGTANNWSMPRPPYPRVTGFSPRVGQTTVRITTDASGRVSNVVILKSTGNPVLDNNTTSYVRNNWHGPPNASRTTDFVYELR